MAPRARIAAATGALVLAAAGAAGCGTERPNLARSDTNYTGEQLFHQNCSGCHTLDAAGAEGSAYKVRDRERVDGPNFNVRKETMPQVLYAIRNGGFSGAIMPENIVTGAQAQAIAKFLAKYSGALAKKPLSPTG